LILKQLKKELHSSTREKLKEAKVGMILKEFGLLLTKNGKLMPDQRISIKMAMKLL